MKVSHERAVITYLKRNCGFFRGLMVWKKIVKDKKFTLETINHILSYFSYFKTEIVSVYLDLIVLQHFWGFQYQYSTHSQSGK
jgi:oligoribonuclease (3'-5' exoribonuclease)